MQILRLLSAECKKVKHTPLLWMHIIIPLIGIGTFLFIFTLSHSTPLSEVCGYLQVIALSFPLLISVVSSMSADQESQAGKFQVLLTSSNPKFLTFLSKFIFLYLLGLCAVMLAVIGYGAGLSGIFHKNPFSLSFYIIAVFILIGANLFEYVFHLLLSLRLGKGASIGVGIAEFLISAILNTDLGDRIWTFFPCTWGIRFVTTWTNFTSKSALKAVKFAMAQQTTSELHSGIMICIIATIVSIMLSSIWFSQWEGKKVEE